MHVPFDDMSCVNRIILQFGSFNLFIQSEQFEQLQTDGGGGGAKIVTLSTLETFVSKSGEYPVAFTILIPVP